MAFPYVTASKEEATMADSLLAGFTETCGSNIRFNNIAFSDSCSVAAASGNFQKLANLQAVHVNRMNLIMVLLYDLEALR